MKKDVLNYLQNIDNTFTANDWRLEAPILSDIRQRKKKPCLAKATAIGLAASAVITGTALTGCEKKNEVPPVNGIFTQSQNNNQTNAGNNENTIKSPNIELKTPEQIQKDGITSKDVVDAYRYLGQYYYINSSGLPLNDINNAEFKEIGSTLVPAEFVSADGKETLAVDTDSNTYIKYDSYTMGDSSYNNVYVVQLKLNTLTCMNWIIDEKSFENVMSSFGNNKSSFTIDMVDPRYQNYVNVDNLIGNDAYSADIRITPETINNATEEQLWALYEMFESMMQINMKNEPEYSLE